MINATSKFVGPLPLAAKKKTLTSPLQQSFLFSDIYSFYFPTVIYVANLEELSMYICSGIAVKWSVHRPNEHDQLDHFSFGH